MLILVLDFQASGPQRDHSVPPCMYSIDVSQYNYIGGTGTLEDSALKSTYLRAQKELSVWLQRRSKKKGRAKYAITGCV